MSKRSRKGLPSALAAWMFPDGAGGEQRDLLHPGEPTTTPGVFRAIRKPARPRGPRREPKHVQNAKIAAAGEKRMRRRMRPQGSAS